MMNAQHTQNTVLLTGASRGIGFATLTRLLESGYKVIATDYQMDALETHCRELKEAYPQQLFLSSLDLTDLKDIPSTVEGLIDQFGPVDHLVSCAGILHLQPILTMPMEQLAHTFDVNVFGQVALMQTVGQRMKQQGTGNMVIVGSNAANTPRANMGAYAASKAALHMMVKCMGMELASTGIRCNIVSPGSTRTDMQMQLWNEHYGEPQVIAGDASTFRLGIPLNKIAEPNDIANTILFLMSDAANHITLHDLRVDGGATLDN
ncbi:2,3-dihydro-2,3-dihydroxybenzoate dehydrogenase [Vibrio tritonius]